jgi:hypothetical protein
VTSCAREQAQTAEALRLYRRYQLEFVEALGLCPWAERARLEGRVSERVLLDGENLLRDSLRVIDEFSARPELEIGLILFAGLRLPRRQFEERVAAVVEADRSRHTLTSPAFALAAFHPQAEAVTSHAERLVPFIRRSPDPTIQLVRVSALERVRQGTSEGTSFFDPFTIDVAKPPPKRQQPLRERVASANLKTIQRLGVAQAEAILHDIFVDRDASYRRIGLWPETP